MQQTPQLVTSPEELEALEREIRQRTDRLGSLLVGHHLQQALDAPTLQAEQAVLVSLLAAMLGSLEEAQDVLAHRGVALDTKTIRTIAYRYAARARLVQQVEHTAFEDTVAGRRVVISSDGGRLRLRETKRGPKTKKGRRHYTGAWREPKVLLVYVVNAEGKREASFAPFIDATLQGPDAVFALLR